MGAGLDLVEIIFTDLIWRKKTWREYTYIFNLYKTLSHFFTDLIFDLTKKKLTREHFTQFFNL